jgi:two-component system, sporulation sensor kinase E
VNGKTAWIRAKARVVEFDGKTNRMVGICEDVTERKLAEANLRETVERLALAQQVGNIAAWEWDLESGRIAWDQAGTQVYGRPPAELATLDDVQRHIHMDDHPALRNDIQGAIQGNREFNAEFRVSWPDGSYHWLLGRGRTVLNEEGVPVRMNGVNIDITDRRTAELTLRQSEKLAAVGQLASTIAHEINNPLEAVTNLLYLSKTSLSDPVAVEQYLTTAEVELRRVAAITNQTLRFHRQQSGPTEITCLDLFSNALLIFQGRIENAGIRVEKRKRAERPVLCLEGEIRQVMNNLIGNAIDAMKQGGGRLLVRSAEGTDWQTGRRGIVLVVADTGKGMSAHTLRHLFEPFFTTKGINGTGLGLWVSQEIVQRHHGRLSVRSSDRKECSGSVFRLFLPFDKIAAV